MADFEKRKISDEEDLKVLRQQTPGKEKILYLEIDNEVTEAYDRIKHVKNDEIFLMIPKKAILLQSMVNLKILKKKAEQLGKRMTIITNDHMGRRMAEQVGIPVFEKMPSLLEKGEKTRPAAPSGAKKENLANEGSVRPMKMSERKFSITELLKRGIVQSTPSIEKVKEWMRKRKKKNQYKTEISIVTPSKPALITLITMSIFLLFAIAYIALPGATIYITPASARIEQPVNVVLADYDRYRADLDSHAPQMIASFKITPPTIEKTFHYPATGKNFQGSNANGIITIFNATGIPWPLVATTRFQTEDGLVFRIREPITLPRGNVEKPGTLDIEVSADLIDAFEQPIGERGNIGPTKFFLPGLKNSENRKNIYATNAKPFSGGFTRVTKIVSKEDIEAASARAKLEMVAAAKEELKKYLDRTNTERNTILKLLTDPQTMTIGEPRVEIPNDPEGKNFESFDVKGAIDIAGIAFNERELLNLLKTELGSRKTPDKKIISISEDSLTHRIFDIDLSAGKVKLTATLRGIEQYDIDLEEEAGAQFLKKIKEHIVGKDIDEATFYMQNLPEIDRVEIKSWPFWAPTLPTVPDNIEFTIQSDEEATQGIEISSSR